MSDRGADPDQPTAEAHAPSEVSYDEQRYPARPKRLRPRGRLRGLFSRPKTERSGKASGENALYVSWLAEQSMLADAIEFGRQFSGQGSMWQNPFANPDPRAAIEKASVWFTAYPISMITKKGSSFLGTLGDEDLWAAFEAIGIDGVHTGPVKQAGGISGWDPTPSVDGHFDRISTQIDADFGTEEEYRAMTEVAAGHLGMVIDDIVPGHTGKGADFRLAEMKVGDYPGIYHMVEIDPKDWHLLPKVRRGDSVNLDVEAEDQLTKAGYIIGRMQRVIFYEPGVKDTNWSATAPVLGPDGVERRWVYLHYFKEGQPTINWLDPSFAGMRMVIGDALHSLGDLGSGALRLDANGFLGVEKSPEDSPAWSEGHPLSEAANQLIASMVRKVGGFTFQELNLTIDDIKSSAERGADLSYDFVNRPAYIHALATGDTEFVRLTLNLSVQHGVEPASLVHALQNHDEMTYELVHFATLHADDLFAFRGTEVRGAELAETIRQDMLDHLTGEAGPYNATFTQNGIASTTATLIAATLGFTEIDDLTPEQRAQIQQAHLLLAMFNALQPGVFALSGWDLLGMLTLDRKQVSSLLAEGDTRWIHRSAYDLMDYRPDATESLSRLPRGTSLYGSLPAQLADPTSFACRLRDLLAVRKRYGIATAVQLDVPQVSNKAMLVMVHQLSDAEQVTVLNFSGAEISGSVISEHLVPGSGLVDMFTDELVGEVDDLHTFSVTLGPYEGRSLLVLCPGDHPVNPHRSTDRPSVRPQD
ncbi:maltose alpha-D-glucosyltransferase [Microlunatus capsulatus]|uniref:Trehalose synthase n=1 Tax=Microlunatus capsulatus TaxID=99117 RepID=A0ABS4Z7R2_9ACTN|nr:maltose alpha-D-glucosyltransferase [Microlunatus capsulatus]MBP2417092.1 trehalose synthase [Microlunatus capsulatus]